MTSRAVARRIEPGMTEECVFCHTPIKFRAGKKQQRIVANVYQDGKWNRVEHFHPSCYLEAGAPHGEASQMPAYT